MRLEIGRDVRHATGPTIAHATGHDRMWAVGRGESAWQDSDAVDNHGQTATERGAPATSGVGGQVADGAGTPRVVGFDGLAAAAGAHGAALAAAVAAAFRDGPAPCRVVGAGEVIGLALALTLPETTLAAVREAVGRAGWVWVDAVTAPVVGDRAPGMGRR